LVLQVVEDLVAQRAASSSSSSRIMSLKDLLMAVIGLDQLLAAERDITGCISDDDKSGVDVVSFRRNVSFSSPFSALTTVDETLSNDRTCSDVADVVNIPSLSKSISFSALLLFMLLVVVAAGAVAIVVLAYILLLRGEVSQVVGLSVLASSGKCKYGHKSIL